jgi:hypothetical protein
MDVEAIRGKVPIQLDNCSQILVVFVLELFLCVCSRTCFVLLLDLVFPSGAQEPNAGR